MSTLERLVKIGALVAFKDDTLESPPVRRIYALPRAVEWFEGVLPSLLTTLSGGKIGAIQQVDVLFDRFTSGLQLQHWLDFHALQPLDYCTWELKTPDVRIFGWFYRMVTFVIASAHEASHVKKYNLYDALARETDWLRQHLDLDEPKYVTGKDPHDVVSNWNYAPR